MFSSPSQILCTVFGVNIYYYGVIIALAITVGFLVSDFLGAKFFNLKKETIIESAPYLIFAGLIGARLYYCVLDYEFYLRFPSEIIAVRHGGLSIHGAILGGFLGLVIFCKKNKLSIKKICDASSLGLILGQAIGRWGNFFNSEAYGVPTNLPWKLYIAPQYRQVPYLDNEFFHPAFLYESILDLAIFAVLLYLVKKCRNLKSGNLSLIYLILYSTARIIVEFCRIDSIRYVFGISFPIVISVIIILASLILLYYNNKKDYRNL